MINNLKNQRFQSPVKNINTKKVTQNLSSNTKDTIDSQDDFSHKDQLSSNFESNIFEKMLCSSSKFEETSNNQNFCQSLVDINKKGLNQQRTFESPNKTKIQTKNDHENIFQDTLSSIDFQDVDYCKENNSESYEVNNDNEDEEEYSIWDDSQLKNSGVDNNSFVDIRGHQLSFYQLYRLRSSLFQIQYTSRLDTIKEVYTIFSNYNKEVKLNDLKNQQMYLDEFYLVQAKQFPIIQQMKDLDTSKSPLKQQKICQTENNQKFKCTQSGQLTNNLKIQSQSIYQTKNNFQKNIKQNSFKDQSQNLPKVWQQKQQFQKNLEFFLIDNQNPKKLQSDFSSSQNMNKNNRYQRRQKVSIDQKLAQKLISDTTIPDKLISFTERSQYQDEQKLQLKIKIDQQATPKSQNNSSEKQTSISCQNLVNNQKVSQQQQQPKQLSLQQTTQTILSYLKKVIFNKNKEDVQKDINSQQSQNLPFLK